MSFSPQPNEFGVPKIFIAGVGPLMTEVAAEVGDGYFVHPFHSTTSFQQLSLPALQRGFDKAGKSRDGYVVSAQVITATGLDQEALDGAIFSARNQIAFYGSTPAYRNVLDIHGWGGLQDELNALSKQGEWAKMGTLIDDEILNTFAVVGEPEQIAPELSQRYGDVIQRISFYAPYQSDPDRWRAVMDALKAA